MQRSRLKNIVNKANNQTNLFDKFVKQLDKIPENYRLREAWIYYDKPSNVDTAIKNGLIKGVDGETKFASIGYNEKTNEFEYLNTGESGEEVDKDLSVWDNDVVPFVSELKKGGFIREFNKELNCWTYKKGDKIGSKKIMGSEQSPSPSIPSQKQIKSILDDAQERKKRELEEEERANRFNNDDFVGSLSNEVDEENLLRLDEMAGEDLYYDYMRYEKYLLDLGIDPNMYAEWYDRNRDYYDLTPRGYLIYHGRPVPEKFKQGGKSDTKKPTRERPSYEEWVKDVNPDFLSDNYDLKSAYYTLDPEQLERWKFAVNSDNPKYYMDFQNEKGEYPYHLGSVAKYPNSNNYFFLKLGTEDSNPELLYELNGYLSGENGLRKTHRLVFDKDLNRYFYIEDPNFDFTQLFKQGGQMNVIPEGALHARKNNMEEGGKAFTHKGIPVMSIDGKEQIAEIEKNEIVFSKSTTDKIEKYYKEYEKDDTSKKRKEEIALECGKFLVEQILDNTDDRTGLILEVNNG